MTREEFISRMEDTGIKSETLRVVLNTLLNTSTIDVHRLSLPTDKKVLNVQEISSKDSYLIASQVLIFKSIIKRMSEMGSEQFIKYGINDEILIKLNRLTDEELNEWFKSNKLPNDDRSIANAIMSIGFMSSLTDMYGSQRIDMFEEKKQETKYKNREKNPEQYTKRIYLNLPLNKIAVEFLSLYKLKCIEKGIPSKMKGMGSSGHDIGDLDTTILYSNDYYLMDHINIIESIIKERPDLVSNFGSPVISGSRVLSKNGECYYTVSSGLLNDNTSNGYYNKLYIVSFAFLCSQYVKSNNKPDIQALCIMRNSDLKEYIRVASSTFDQNIKNKIISDGYFEQIVRQVSSFLRFGDFEHIGVPLYQDDIFAKFVENIDTKENDNSDERELYLYHTEDLISNVLKLYQQGDVSFNQLMENYLKRITDIYKMYRYYALREPGFIMSERNKEVTEIFYKLLNEYELPEKMEGIEKLEYYQSVQSGVNDYLNNKDKRI